MTEVAGDISRPNTTTPQETADFTGLLKGLGLGGLTQDGCGVVLKRALEEIVGYFHADHGYIMLEDNEDKLQCEASWGLTEQEDGMLTASAALMQKVVKDGAGFVANDAMNNEEFEGDPEFQRFNIATAMCGPIKTGGAAFGVVYLDSQAERSWGGQQIETLDVIGQFIATALGNVRAQKTQEESKRLIAAGKATLNLSHSVKNILQMISGAAEVVDFGLRTNQIHRVKRSWDILKPNLERMRKYTLELLDYSKERQLNTGPCDFNRVIQGAIESLKSQLKQKNSKINIRIDQKMPTIDLDGERIHEMALNIILNAIDIVDDNGGLVSVETKYHEDRQVVSLAVTDNGPGISDEMKEKIFTPFESEKKGFGTGLGMPIAKQIIDQHEGTIEIEALPSGGSTFTIYLPANITEESEQ